MNQRTFARAALAISLLLTAACGQSGAPAAEQGTLAGSNIGGPFSLIDQDGRCELPDGHAGRHQASIPQSGLAPATMYWSDPEVQL